MHAFAKFSTILALIIKILFNENKKIQSECGWVYE
jgi:hypothetical protein